MIRTWIVAHFSKPFETELTQYQFYLPLRTEALTFCYSKYPLLSSFGKCVRDVYVSKLAFLLNVFLICMLSVLRRISFPPSFAHCELLMSKLPGPCWICTYIPFSKRSSPNEASSVFPVINMVTIDLYIKWHFTVL